MPYEVEETGKLTRLVTVTITGEERSRRVKNELKRLSRTVKIRGFRKGKIPMGAIRQRYGDSVNMDVLNKLIQEHMERLVGESDQPVAHVGSPNLDSAPGGESEDFEFTVEIEVQPVVDPIGYLGLALEQERIEVTKEMVDERIEALRDRFATLEPISLREKIAEGDVVTFDYEALGVEEVPELANFRGSGAQFEIGRGNSSELDGLQEGLTGLPLSGVHTIEVTPREGFGAPNLIDKPVSLQITVNEVKHKVLPEVDDEFAKDTGEAETVLELRAQLREEITEEFEHLASHQLEEQAVEQVLAQHEVDLPPKFVGEQVEQEIRSRMMALQQALQQGMSPEAMGIDLETFTDQDLVRETVEEELRSQFVLGAIFKKEELSVEQDDLMETIEHMAMHRGVRPQQLMQQLMQDPDGVQRIQSIAMLEKTRAFLVEKAEITEVEPGTLSEKEDAKEKSAKKSSDTDEKAAAKSKKASAAKDKADKSEKKSAPKKKAATKAKAADDEGAEKAEKAKKKPAEKKKAAPKKKADQEKADEAKADARGAAAKKSSAKKSTAKKSTTKKSTTKKSSSKKQENEADED